MAKNQSPGNQEWVRSVVARYEGPLLRYAARIAGDVERGRDIVQETFLRLCSEDQGRIEDHLAEWLFTVCRNRALDVRKKEGRMNPLSRAQLDARASHADGPAAVAERREAVTLVLQALEAIPENQQEVIRLKFQEGLSYREISRITGHTVSNVGVLIHTGIKLIRHRLNAESGLTRRA